MKAIRVALLTGTLLIGSAFPALAGAAPAQPNPAQACGAENATQFQTPFGPLTTPNRGGCASTRATGKLSQAAYIANCKEIKAEADAAGPGTFPYEAFYGDVNLNPQQYGFGGKISTCATVLEKYHTGQYGGH